MPTGKPWKELISLLENGLASVSGSSDAGVSLWGAPGT